MSQAARTAARINLRSGEHTLLGRPDAKLPGGVYLYEHSSLCASNATGHGPCTCDPLWRHSFGLRRRHPYGCV